ncbi:MAG TPA: ABC transporter substrate-binding protein [Candidatus Binatia bacterium]|nr:ABC transporter substrate-binding protein [Candidatus Binatia bacterium]
MLAAKELGIFSRNKLEVEILLLTSQLSAVALGAGELEYVAGVGPGSVSGTLAGIPSRAVWVVSNRILHSVVAQPELKTLQDLRGKKIGVTGLGGTTHTSLMIAIEKSGGNPKEFFVVSLGPQQYLRALESKAVDAATIDPPLLFLVLKKGFSRILDLGSAIEMPVGGLTTLTKTLNTKPDQVLRVIKALQESKELLLKERAVDFIMKMMKMDRDTAFRSYELMVTAWGGTGIPSRLGMENIVKGIQSQGRFADRKVSFEDVADPRLAMQVMRELGHKIE